MSSFRVLRPSFAAGAFFLAYHIVIMMLSSPRTSPAISPGVRPPDELLELDGVAVIPFPVEEA